ncbi:pre-B-cell leukemia homeobox interacting protein 1b isoform X4 [Channa argus]|uniref:pre-B-cell leukemia homeobox interacting protein 1b isoform X4 n=1 Tax=Channa argus TaxID=215402 RepID=UPI0035223BFE
MSGCSSANNSWTILTPEETLAETLKPLAEGTEPNGERLASAAGFCCNRPENCSGPAEAPVDCHLVSEKQSGDTSTEHQPSVPTTVTDPTVSTSSEVSGSLFTDSNAFSQSTGLSEGPAESSPDPDSFSDSYTHITPSPDEPPTSLLRTETLEGGEFIQEEERLSEEGALHLLYGEEPQKEREGSDLSSEMTDIGKQAGSFVVSEFLEDRTKKTGEEGEPEVRRRSILEAFERIGRKEEEEEAEEDFQLPRRDEDSGLSVNKCILGAVILLGLGTIFISGFFMDLDEESEYGTRELKDSEVPGKQEWLNSEVPSSAVNADNTEILNKLAEGNQQILALQAQLQAQKEELKVARGQAAQEAKERLRWQEVEKENSRLKAAMASLPVLQKENERMKRELESVLNLQKELETLRSTLTELKLSSASEAAQESVKLTTLPPSGQAKDTRQGTAGTEEKEAKKAWDEQNENKKNWKKKKYDIGEKDWKGRDRKEGHKMDRKDVGKTEWKMEKHEQGKSDKEKDKENKKKKDSDETKQWKEEMASKGDEGKPWKAREGNKEWIEKSERKDLKKGKDWKKTKHEKVNDGKQWRDREENIDWKGGNDHEERYRGKGEKEWKKMKGGFKESGKEKWERKDWKEKGEKREWKKNGKEGKGKGNRKQWEEGENHGKSRDKERREKGERKQRSENKWNSKNGKDDKELKRKDERKPEKREEWKRDGEREQMHGAWKKDRSTFQKHKDEHTFISNHNHNHQEEQVWGDRDSPHTHRRPSLEQPDYWDQQRDRLQHNSKPSQHCSSLETCAQAEGLLPVTLPEFEAVLQIYLDKAEEVGVEAFIREELKKLTTEFFKNGVFVHDQMSFQDFVEDVSDILEHMVEGNKNGEAEDSAIEEEIEEFENEVIKKFSVPAVAEKEVKGEWRKENRRGRG